MSGIIAVPLQLAFQQMYSNLGFPLITRGIATYRLLLVQAVSFSKSQIDKLGERLAWQALTSRDLRLLDAYRRSFRDAYNSVISVCRRAIRAPVTGRPSKSTTAIVEKLRRESVRLSQIQDIAGCRIVVQDSGRQELVADTLEVFLGPTKRIDRRTVPSHGYRAIHLVSLTTQLPVEIQIRTALQHRWAELSEKFSDLVDHGIKYGRGDASIVELLSLISSTIANFEETEMERHHALQALEGNRKLLPKKMQRDMREANRAYFRRQRALSKALEQLYSQVSAQEPSK